MIHSRKARGPGSLVGLAVAGLAAASLLLTVLPLAARLWWAFELFTHFRLQYAAAQILLLPALLMLGRARLGAATIGGLLLNAAVLAPQDTNTAARALGRAAPSSFTVLTANIAHRNALAAPLLDIVRRESPDVLLLVEFTPGWEASLAPLYSVYPHQLRLPRNGAFGLALLSRLPIAEARSIRIESAPAIDARISAPSGEIRLIGLHLQSPTSALRARERNRQLDALARMLAGIEEPLIVAGDFNVTPYSPYFSRWLAETGLRVPAASPGRTITWPAFFPVLGIPIDHCLASEGLAALEYRRLSDIGSDHYPVLARFAVTGRPGSPGERLAP